MMRGVGACKQKERESEEYYAYSSYHRAKRQERKEKYIRELQIRKQKA
jgi:hypothetical protein